MNRKNIKGTFFAQIAGDKNKLSQAQIWLDYDTDADVLYVHFEEKPSSNHSEMRDDGIILDYREKELVGLTILDASQR